MEGTLAVVSQTGQSLSFFDMPSGKRTAQLTDLIAEPHELCHDPKRNLLYMTHAYRHGHYWVHGEDSHEISVVDLSTKSIVAVIDTRPAKGPHGIYIDAGHDILYVSVEVLPGHEGGGGGIIGIDLHTRQTIKTIPSGYRTHWFVMTPDGKKSYCCNKTAPFISVLDLENERMLAKIPVPSCEEPSISLNGRFVYFPTPGFQFGVNPADPKIEVIDTTTDTIVESIVVDSGVLPVHVGPSGHILAGQYHFADVSKGEGPEANRAKLVVYDGQTHEKLGEAPIGLWPLTVRCSSDGKMAFVANIMDGTVSVVDLESRSRVGTIDVDKERRADKKGHVGAHGLAFIPRQSVLNGVAEVH